MNNLLRYTIAGTAWLMLPLLTLQAQELWMEYGMNRITSYNVCYTKLLRKTRMKLRRLFVAVWLCIAGGAWAQYTIEGTVSDAENGNRLAGAGIRLNASNSGAITNDTGYFRITSYNVCYTKLLRKIYFNEN